MTSKQVISTLFTKGSEEQVGDKLLITYLCSCGRKRVQNPTRVVTEIYLVIAGNRVKKYLSREERNLTVDGNALDLGVDIVNIPTATELYDVNTEKS
jgi:hypothetical protein